MGTLLRLGVACPGRAGEGTDPSGPPSGARVGSTGREVGVGGRGGFDFLLRQRQCTKPCLECMSVRGCGATSLPFIVVHSFDCFNACCKEVEMSS